MRHARNIQRRRREFDANKIQIGIQLDRVAGNGRIRQRRYRKSCAPGIDHYIRVSITEHGYHVSRSLRWGCRRHRRDSNRTGTTATSTARNLLDVVVVEGPVVRIGIGGA